jgi:eukaryotic-like serine/threonine-protein kinase
MTVVESGEQLLLAGTIDETARLGDLIPRARNGRLILDLAGITFINSIGVREWCLMQKAATTAKLALELRRVAEPLVHQLNIVPAARGASIVTSFFAPYECDECDREFEILLDVRKHGQDFARMQAPKQQCPECDAELVFGHPPELYFTFMH